MSVTEKPAAAYWVQGEDGLIICRADPFTLLVRDSGNTRFVFSVNGPVRFDSSVDYLTEHDACVAAAAKWRELVAGQR